MALPADAISSTGTSGKQRRITNVARVLPLDGYPSMQIFVCRPAIRASRPRALPKRCDEPVGEGRSARGPVCPRADRADAHQTLTAVRHE